MDSNQRLEVEAHAFRIMTGRMARLVEALAAIKAMDPTNRKAESQLYEVTFNLLRCCLRLEDRLDGWEKALPPAEACECEPSMNTIPDLPHYLEHAWQEYLTQVVPDDIGPQELKDLKLAFFNGSMVALAIVSRKRHGFLSTKHSLTPLLNTLSNQAWHEAQQGVPWVPFP